MKKFNVYFNLVVNGVIKEGVKEVEALNRSHAFGRSHSVIPAGARVTAVKKVHTEAVVNLGGYLKAEKPHENLRCFDVTYDVIVDGVKVATKIIVVEAFHRSNALLRFMKIAGKEHRFVSAYRTHRILDIRCY